MEEINDIELSEENQRELEKDKNNFFDTPFGKFVDNSLNIAISAVFPSIVDDQIINIKDAIIVGGFEAGLEELKNTGTNYKEALDGLISGNFKSIEQMRTVVKDGGLLDIVSFCIDKGLNYIEKKNIVGKEVTNLIRTGKNALINQVSNSIEKKYSGQLEHVEKLSKCCDNWKVAFENKDIDNMNKYYKQMNVQRKGIVQIEEIVKRAETIKNIHNLVSSSGGFDLTKEEIELANKI